MTWWSALPALIFVVLILFIPGAALATSAGARGISVLTLAAPAGVGMVGFAGLLGGLLHIEWSVLWLASCAAVSALGLYAVRRLLTRRRHTPWRGGVNDWEGWAGTLAGAALAFVTIALQVKTGMGRPENIAQRYDDVFHLNAIRFIIESGDASTLHLGRMLQPELGLAIYPSAWHSIAALAAKVTELDVPVSANALNLVIASLVWPLSCLFLTRTILGGRNFSAVATGILVAAFPAFPLSLLEYGTLFPNMLSYSILPAALGLVIALSRLMSASSYWSGAGLALLLLVLVGGLGTSQPNGAVALLAMSVPIGIWCWGRWCRPFAGSKSDRQYWFRITSLPIAGIVFVVLWGLLLTGFADRQPFTSGGSALGQAITGSVAADQTSWLLAAPILLGSAVLIAGGSLVRANSRFVLLSIFAVVVFLYVVSASVPQGQFREAILGSWYQDSPRLAALVPIPSIIVATIGVTELYERTRSVFTARLQAMQGRHAKIIGVAVGIALILFLQQTTFSPAMKEAVRRVGNAYSFEGNNAQVLTLDELALIQKLPELVPQDTLLAVNPWNGGALAYAYTGIEVTQYHMGPQNPSVKLLANTIDTASPGSNSCEAANEIGLEYVLDFGSDYLLDFEPAFTYPAFDDVGPDSNLKLVHRIGDAALYRITSCS